MKTTCPKCGYTWDYGGKLKSRTCPNCRHVFGARRRRKRGKT